MAIDFTDVSSITDTLKFIYGDVIVQQFAQEDTLYNKLPVSDVSPGGRGFECSVTLADPQGGGARQESGKLPDALVGKFDMTRITPKYIYHSSRLTGPAIEKGKSNAASFMDVQENQMKGSYRAVVHMLNRMAWGDGSGHLGTLSAVSDTLDVTASNTWDVVCNNDLGVRYFRPGQLLDFYTSGGAVDQSSVASRIKTIDTTNKTLIMEGNDGTYKTNHPAFSGYTIVAETVPNAARAVAMASRDAAYSTSDTAVEMMGLLGIFDDSTLITTFQNIDASAVYEWRANILSNSSVNRELTEDLLLSAADTARTNSGREPERMYMGQGQRRKLANLYLNDVRFVPQKLEGGYEKLTFSAAGHPIDIIVDPVAQPNKIFLSTNDAVERFELLPLGWLDRDQVMHMRSGYDEWDLVLAIYTELGTKQRNNCTLISDLTEPA